jgi:hypothetical protein
MVRAAFKLPLRQTEGLMASVLTLMGLTLSAPDHNGYVVRGDAVGDPGDVGAARSVARMFRLPGIDRRHRPSALQSGSTAGDET